MAMVSPLERIRASSGGLETQGLPRLRETGPGNGPSFGDTLKDVVHGVNEQQVSANDMALRFMAGEVEHVHDAMLALQKARTSFSFLVEVRNKLLDGYKEIMRMQI
ncbi:MAG: flagellar hook-basal body complex protein FliE [Calditrichaeota bacterium]|nr:flagellar hook-basal body complex protein FliE [Calditrichota bacterium]